MALERFEKRFVLGAHGFVESLGSGSRVDKFFVISKLKLKVSRNSNQGRQNTSTLGVIQPIIAMASSRDSSSGWSIKSWITGKITARSVANASALELASVPVASRDVVSVTVSGAVVSAVKWISVVGAESAVSAKSVAQGESVVNVDVMLVLGVSVVVGEAVFDESTVEVSELLREMLVSELENVWLVVLVEVGEVPGTEPSNRIGGKLIYGIKPDFGPLIALHLNLMGLHGYKSRLRMGGTWVQLRYLYQTQYSRPK